jgi:hypothetical protein
MYKSTNTTKYLICYSFMHLFNLHPIISAKSVESHLENVYDDIIVCPSVEINYVKALFFFSPVKICVVKRQRVYYIAKKDKLVIFTCYNRKRMLPHGEIPFSVSVEKKLKSMHHRSKIYSSFFSHTGETTVRGNVPCTVVTP